MGIKAKDNPAAVNKGVALIVAIFAMMVFGVLGWTLTSMLSGDFEMNLRNFDSARSFTLAESGAQWGMKELAKDWSCDWSGSSSALHTVPGYGQYRVNGTCPTCPGSAGNPTYCSDCDQIVLNVTGFIPSESNYRTKRNVSVKVGRGGLANSLTAQLIFDWYNTSSHSVDIDGYIKALYFDGDGDSTYNENGTDYGNAPNLPPGDSMRVVGSGTIPEIDMAYYKNYAQNIHGTVYHGNTVFNNANYNNEGVMYVEGTATINLNGRDINFNHASVVAEGDIVITGTGGLSMLAYVDASAHATMVNLGTKEGNITSLSTPDGMNEKQKRLARAFDGMIYSQNGTVQFNYITGVAIIGKNIRLKGSIDLEYDSRYIGSDGYTGGIIDPIEWREY